MMFKKVLISVAAIFLLSLPDAPADEVTQNDLGSGKVLIIVAHPDDEFMMSGTVAMLTDNNYDVSVIYATSGDAGLDVSGQGLKDESLAKVREGEVSNALKILGVKNPPIFLRFKDGKLTEVRDQLADKFTELIAEIKPSIVITFGPDGVTGHHDHIAVCSAVTEAFDDQKAVSCKTLLNFAVSNKRISSLRQCSKVDYVENFFEGVDNSSVNIVVDTSKYRQQRIDSFFIHYTQFNQNYRTAWVKFTANSPYEEFVIARMKGKFTAVSSFKDLLDKKL